MKKHVILLILAGLIAPLSAEKLHDVVTEGNMADVKKAVEETKDINVLDEKGYTALHWAAMSGELDAAKFLISKGADVNARGSISGYTPLHWAAAFGKLDLVKLLIEKGADVNARGKDNETPLDKAKFVEKADIVDYLKSNGAK